MFYLVTGSMDRSGSFLPSGVDASTISLLQYLEDGAATGSRNAPEVSATGDSVDLVPVPLFPVSRDLVSSFHDKRDRAYIGRRSGRRQGRSYIGRKKRNFPFDEWTGSAEKDIVDRGRVSDVMTTTEDLAQNKWPGLRRVGSAEKNMRTFIRKGEESNPWYVDFKRARSFIGKRENPLDEYVDEQRVQTLAGNRGSTGRNVLVNIPTDVWQSFDIDQKAKRARSYIGKRYLGPKERERDLVDQLTPFASEEKRGRSFIGKRDTRVENVGGQWFTGKKQEVQKSHRGALIRKREVSSVEDNRGWSSTENKYTKVQNKRARSFIGKRYNFESDGKMRETVPV